MLGFLSFIPMWSKGSNEKVRMSHLFKWKVVRLVSEIQWEELIWEGKIVTNHWERKKERENHSNFRILTRKCFSNCNCGFAHRWIRLIFGQKFIRMWYFKLSGWIGKKIYVERNKCFALSAIYFRVLSFCCYCTNWGFVWFLRKEKWREGRQFFS